MEENEVRHDYPMSDLLRTMTIIVCLLLQMAGRTLSQGEYSYLFNYYENYETNHGYNDTPLECYRCGAYQHSDGADFNVKLKNCRNNVGTAVIETCPTFYAGQPTYRYCGATVQTVFGHVTSFTRGCHFLRPCKELSYCNGANDTGVCQYCCHTSLCNHGNVQYLSVPLLLLVAMVTWIYQLR